MTASTPLASIALAHFTHLRAINPCWHLEDLLHHLNLQPSDEITALVAQAGFQPRSEPSPDEVLRVANIMLRGISSADIIARESGLSVE
jgi:hypothetical protein